MIAVQSGLIGFLATSPAGNNSHFRIAIDLSLACFAVSILAAGWVLSALPYILIRLLEQKDPNIYFMRLSSAPVLRTIPLWLMGAIQHWAFAIGVLCLVIGRIAYGNA